MNGRARDLFAARDPSDRDAADQACVDLRRLAETPVDGWYDVWRKAAA